MLPAPPWWQIAPRIFTLAVKPRIAATVVLVRDSESGPEVLLLKRNRALVFAGGLWVFPGGALDPQDWDGAGDDEARAARIAAAREAQEESGLLVDPELMVQVSHWTTPVAEPKRFYTWFFLALASDDAAVEIDGSEIHDHQWTNIAEAVRQHEAGEFGMLPPTVMTLRAMCGYMSAEEIMVGIAARDPQQVFPVFAKSDSIIAVLFKGDAGYASSDPAVAGARHRAVMVDSAWQYQHDSGAEVARLDS
jgi:8-oxo-dGTP pyrophosphatase MutT (NUDIX family)